MAVEIRIGDALEQLRQMPDGSVHCCVTSPPYWGLRSYLADGDPSKPHEMGSEETPDEWCARLVEVFREVKRVLRKDGTCWVNVGDSYAQTTTRHREGPTGIAGRPRGETWIDDGRSTAVGGLKPKDLIGQPWLLAFALRADGWFLRDAIVWAKPNPMPESVKDRCTNAYEHVFLLARDKRYFFDAEAIKEQAADSVLSRSKYMTGGTKIALNGDRQDGDKGQRTSFRDWENGRNCRNVWTIATEAFSEAHFATFPTELARRCILAGCPVGGTVLDPFGGAGTTALVADRLQRNAVLIELNADYAAMARRRIDTDRGDLLDIIDQPKPEQGSLCLVP